MYDTGNRSNTRRFYTCFDTARGDTAQPPIHHKPISHVPDSTQPVSTHQFFSTKLVCTTVPRFCNSCRRLILTSNSVQRLQVQNIPIPQIDEKNSSKKKEDRTDGASSSEVKIDRLHESHTYFPIKFLKTSFQVSLINLTIL